MKRTPLVLAVWLVGAWLAGCAMSTAPRPAEPTVAPVLPLAPTSTPTLDLPIAPEVGALAPGVSLPTLTGETVSLSDYRGKVVLLNFWTTW